MAELNIYQRMLAAMKEIGAIKKDRKNQAQGYEYLSEEAVKTGVHQALVKHGILFKLSATDHEMIQREGVNRSGQPSVTTFSNMRFEWAFINADKGDDRINGIWVSSAADNSDKSHTKAITYAIREIFKSQFVISTGELDSDPDGETPEVMVRSVFPAPTSAVTFESDFGTAPVCPDGHGAMRLKHSAKNNSDFWGCTAYPNCKKTMPAKVAVSVPPTPPAPVDEAPESNILDEVPF